MSLCVDALRVSQGFTPIIDNLSFTLNQGESMAILGPSASGKTTLLRVILGLNRSMRVSGSISWAHRIIQDDHRRMPLKDRRFSYVPQGLALWPHLKVSESVRLACRWAGQESRFADELLGKCGLEAFQKKLPKELSGGQRQRLAIARALASRPCLLLLDEPFSALDVMAKQELSDLIKDFQALLSFTMLFVSHDLNETVIMGEKIMIMDQGKKLWLGPRKDIRSACFPAQWNPLSAPLNNALALLNS